MKIKTLLCVWAVVLLCGMAFSPAAFAQASLADGDTHDFTVMIDEDEEIITVIQDALNPNQWYYVPNKPRLVTSLDKMGKDKKQRIPQFTLVKYQAKDPANPQNLLEGAVLQCAINLALPPGGLENLKKQIIAKFKLDEKKFLITPLSMIDGKFAVYTPGGEKMGEAPQAPDVAPAFANQAIPLQINLTKLGADFVDTLCKSGGGVPVMIMFEFNGLTPKAGFTVELNYDQTFKHLSTDTKAKASFGGAIWGANINANVSTTREDLTTNKCMKIDVIAGEHFTNEQIDSYLQPILAKLQEEMFSIEAPEKVDPAAAADPETDSSKMVSVGVSFSLKSVEKVKKGTTKIDMQRRQIMKRKTIVGGLIGLGNYPKEVQDRCIVTMPPGNWASAWYSLPDPGAAQAIGINEIAIQVGICDKDGKPVAKVPQQMCKWTAKDGVWKDPKGNDRTTLLFAMQGIYEIYKGREKELQYDQKIDVTQVMNNKTTKYTFKCRLPMFDGEAAISSPLSNIEPVEVNGSLLSWYGNPYPDVTGEKFAGTLSDLTNVVITLKTDKPAKQYTGSLTNKSLSNIFLLEKQLSVNKDGEIEAVVPKVTGQFLFNTKKYKTTITSADFLVEKGNEAFLVDLDFLPIGKK